MRLEELMEKIKKKQLERNLLQNDLSSLRGSIAYYTKKGNVEKVKELKRELVKVMREYRKLREELNELYKLWRENFGGKVS